MPTETETHIPPTIEPEPGYDETASAETVSASGPSEQEPLRESVDTVRDIMNRWHQEYDAAEGEIKQELAYRLIKMGEALSLSGLNADEVKIRETAPGVLGFYVPATGEIAITPAGLSLPAEHFSDVLVHEATHAGKTTGKEVADEGLAQIITRRKVAGAMSGIYETEQQQVQETFERVDLASVIDAYDFEHPKELIELYLRTEWSDAWRQRWSAELAGHDLSLPEIRDMALEHQLGDWTDTIEQNLQDAAPRLFEKAEAEGFDFTDAHQRLLQELFEESREPGYAAAA